MLANGRPPASMKCYLVCFCSVKERFQLSQKNRCKNVSYLDILGVYHYESWPDITNFPLNTAHAFIVKKPSCYSVSAVIIPC